MSVTIHTGDVLSGLAKIESGTVQTCVTSPPYWGLRDYGVEGQIGLEPSPDAYVARMVEVFREVRRCLRDDGTLWLNLGDSYAGSSTGADMPPEPGHTREDDGRVKTGNGENKHRRPSSGLKPKDLCMIPWRVALALQADGWWLRSVIVWAKKSPMPESVTDRPTSSWEPIFLLAKSERYYYDAEAVKEKVGEETRRAATFRNGGDYTGGNSFDNSIKKEKDSHGDGIGSLGGRNQRNVWHLGPEPYAEAHFATFPTEIPRRCILAGSKPGDLVLDPFLGSGTTIAVAAQLGRNGVGCELNPEYVKLAQDRIGRATRPNTYQSDKAVDAPLFGVTL